ncbi:MAG: Protein-L-isoaspartate O-methyltransferase [uncultured Sphingomonadaceae bacterium]|uniref:Protein-L-isoaspartate O-methyltransferase n=1 Tax=uncultured Sphingomonadaceae bacterium TaxID=169976 RepID=A0A6J4SCP6_9SPHN|nr:MAG: Protein-L-isoaspartate O-methyltransferase [uncultured Sphingomonadaceae bacterium]
MSSEFEIMRAAMVDSQLRPDAVNDARVVAAMAAVPRERFVPPHLATLAYIDRPLPLGGGRGLSPPVAVGRLLTEAEIEPDDRVLVVGHAGGYSAALLARLAAYVVALEEEPALAEIGRRTLADLANVLPVEGPLAAGHPAGAPYDVILIDGAVEAIPDALVEQLRDGGRLAAAVNEDGVTRLVIGRRAGGGFGYISFADSAAAALPGFRRPRAFVF